MLGVGEARACENEARCSRNKRNEQDRGNALYVTATCESAEESSGKCEQRKRDKKVNGRMRVTGRGSVDVTENDLLRADCQIVRSVQNAGFEVERPAKRPERKTTNRWSAEQLTLAAVAAKALRCVSATARADARVVSGMR
jgi:hypothetical protein